MPFEPGDVIAGKYRIQNLIGTGGVGFVVAATHVGLDDSVALKFLKPEFATHQEAVTRFTIEARASFKIKNEHVARVLDVDTLPDGTPFIVMELLEGRDLRSVLESHRYLPIELAVDFGLQCCEALAAAHACQIVHRDIKPENLFVTHIGDDDHIKVLDFGISKVALTQQQRPVRKTRATVLTMMAVGTPPYMSPEQVRASTDLDARADIWSLGCVLYEMVSGTAPFERMSLMQACAAVLEDEPLPLREVCPDAPEALELAVMRCLRKSPAERFADVAELARAIAPFGSRNVQCADRCADLLAEAIRRSDPGFRPSEAPLRRSTPMRNSTRVRPAAHILATTPATASNVPVVAQVVPAPHAHPSHRAHHSQVDTSIEILTEADLEPRGNRWILAAVGALTILSGAYLVVQYADRRTADPATAAPASAPHIARTNLPSESGAPEFTPAVVGSAPAPPVTAVESAGPASPPPPAMQPEAIAAPASAAAIAAPAKPAALPTEQARRTKPNAIVRAAPAKDEDPDVGF